MKNLISIVEDKVTTTTTYIKGIIKISITLDDEDLQYFGGFNYQTNVGKT